MRYKSCKLLIIVVSVLVLFSALALFAGTSKRRGTAGAMELLIPVGSQGTALGGNYTAGITGIEAMYWNPAGMAETDRTAEVVASRLQYIADININYAAVQGKFAGIGVFGLSLKSMDFGDIPVTTEEAPDGTGEIFSPSFVTVGLSYSRAMTDRIYFGITGKLVSESIINTSATGVAFDFGVQYKSDIGLRLGVALRNLGTSMTFNGSDLERRVYFPGYVSQPVGRAEDLRITAASFELPTTMDIGLAYAYEPVEGHEIVAMGNFRNNHFGMDGYGAGLEYNFIMEGFKVSVRGAASISNDVEEETFRFMDDDAIFGPSMGGGLYFKLAENLHLNVDYAYQMTERFSSNQWLTFMLGF
ncbi:PorV/PorQ family protein [bacterium]|nr:PorV/PorQ family protein [bacterium]